MKGTLWEAEAVWQAEAEAATYGYATERGEWEQDHPRPTLKKTLLDLAGRHDEEPPND